MTRLKPRKLPNGPPESSHRAALHRHGASFPPTANHFTEAMGESYYILRFCQLKNVDFARFSQLLKNKRRKWSVIWRFRPSHPMCAIIAFKTSQRFATPYTSLVLSDATFC